MANKYILDSSAWIEYFAGTTLGEHVKKFIENDEILTCILSIAEISDKFSKEKEKFDDFLAFIKTSSYISNITLSSCSQCGRLKAERRSTKKKFSLADAIIYLTSKENSCILITKDDDFEGLKDVLILKS